MVGCYIVSCMFLPVSCSVSEKKEGWYLNKGLNTIGVASAFSTQNILTAVLLKRRKMFQEVSFEMRFRVGSHLVGTLCSLKCSVSAVAVFTISSLQWDYSRFLSES